MRYYQKYFEENEKTIDKKKFKYLLSPILVKNNFKHGFFTKTSSEINLTLLTNNQNQNCCLKQIHSNKIVFGSKTQNADFPKGDGIVCDKNNQNLWIYTADCMPILFADKTKRFVAAVHCGRKGLENKIIKSLIKIFDNLGTKRKDIIVAIGPSISKKNYLIDYKTLKEFYEKIYCRESNFLIDTPIKHYLKNLSKHKNHPLIPLDIKKIAYSQLINENILKSNIDISRVCTYESKDDFYSWRRHKTTYRQWSFISTP